MTPGSMSEHMMKKDAATVYENAQKWCDAKIADAGCCIQNFANEHGLDLADLCFVVVGSMGRSEALAASDLDLVPIARTGSALEQYECRDSQLREHLCEALATKVSKGKHLTKADTIASLIRRESIGGDDDNSQNLTRRILVLTEGRQVSGGYALRKVKKDILGAYGGEERSRGRHILSLCNDIARYYRTLCVEYKTKADKEEENWCTRNLKLRHSRKVWYFSCVAAIAKLAEEFPRGDSEYKDRLLEAFEVCPVSRLVNALGDSQGFEVGRLLETYSVFLRFMSDESHRALLSRVTHENRYEYSSDNPFPMLKFNSDLLHRHILDIIEGMERSTRQRVLDWFLF